MRAKFSQAHFLHRSQALLTLLLSRSSLLLFAGGDLGSSELALAGVTVVTASIPLAGVHLAVDACFGSTSTETFRVVLFSFMVGASDFVVTYCSSGSGSGVRS
jgi:hypothetical protein